jgi:hypothetical protein
MKLPIEIRNKIYACFIDELRGNVKSNAAARRTVSTGSGAPPKYTGPTLHLYVFDKTFDPDHEDDNGPVEPMLVQGAPDTRNVDPRTGKPLNILEMYKALKEGEWDSDEEAKLPSDWKRLRMEETGPWKEEEPDASMSDAEDEESDWDSDEAEIATNLKQNAAPVINIEGDDSDVQKVKPAAANKASRKPVKQEVIIIDSSDESEEEEYIPSDGEESSSSDDSSEASDEDEDEDITQDLPEDDDVNDPTYHDSDYDQEYIAQANSLAAKRNRNLNLWTPGCYVAIYSRTLTSPDCPVHRPAGDTLNNTLDFEDLWACATCSHRDPAAYDNLRRLAQVSPLMSTELGNALWHGSAVEFDGPETFLSLAIDRPAVLPLIRRVVLNLEIHPILPFGKAGTKNLASVIEIVTGKMDLDTFRVQLGTPGTFYVDSEPEPEWGREWREEWAPLFKGLKTRKLELGIVEGWEVKVGEGVKQEEGEVEAVLESWMEGLLAEWMPDCLRREGSREIKSEETEEPVKMVLRLRG